MEWPRLSLAPHLAGVEAVTVCQAAVSVSASVKQRRLLVSPVTKIQPAVRSSLTCWLETPVMFLSSWPAGTLHSLRLRVSAVSARLPASSTWQTGQACPARVVVAAPPPRPRTDHSLALRSSEPERRRSPSILTHLTRDT